MTALTKKYVEEANQIYKGAHEGYEKVKVLCCESDDKEEFLTKAIVTEKVEMDGLGLHAYAEGGPAKGTGANTTEKKVKVAEALTSKPIWVNEWGYSSENNETVNTAQTKEGVELLNNNVTLPHVEGWADYQLRDAVHPVWSAGTTYSKEEEVEWKGYVYESRTNGNVGHEPPEATNWKFSHEGNFGMVRGDFTHRETFAAFVGANK